MKTVGVCAFPMLNCLEIKSFCFLHRNSSPKYCVFEMYELSYMGVHSWKDVSEYDWHAGGINLLEKNEIFISKKSLYYLYFAVKCDFSTNSVVRYLHFNRFFLMIN